MVTRAPAKALNKDRVMFLDPIRTRSAPTVLSTTTVLQRLLQDVTLDLLHNPEDWVDRNEAAAKWASPWRRPPSIASR